MIQAARIRTGRLDLLPARPAHAEEMAGALADPALYGFIGGAPPAPAALRGRYERITAGSPAPAVSWCTWVIWLQEAGCLTGYVEATITGPADPGGPAVAEIAWVVGTPWQGRGIATEAARALVGWLRRQPVRTVIAHIHPGHHASAAVAAASGLAPTTVWQDGEVRWSLTV